MSVNADIAAPETRSVGAASALGLRRRQALVAVGVAVVVGLLGTQLPSVLSSSYYLSIVTDGVVLGIMAIGIGFLAHRCGLFSLGHTAFYGSAAYGVAIATAHWGWGPTEATLFAVAGGTLLAVAIGAVVVRTPGMGFLMLTLAFGIALYQVSILTSVRSVTGAFDGLTVTYPTSKTFFGLTQAQLGDAKTFWPIAWCVLVAIALGLWALGRSRFGVVLEAIRENEERARFSGFGPKSAQDACRSLKDNGYECFATRG